MSKKYIVTLTQVERATLQALIASGKGEARRLAHGRVSLKADIERIRRRFVEEGIEAALDPRRAETPRVCKIDGEVEAHLIALACRAPVSHETVRRALKKTHCSLGASSNG